MAKKVALPGDSVPRVGESVSHEALPCKETLQSRSAEPVLEILTCCDPPLVKLMSVVFKFIAGHIPSRQESKILRMPSVLLATSSSASSTRPTMRARPFLARGGVGASGA